MLLNYDRAMAVMERHGLAAIVGHLPENVLYMTGCDGVFNMAAIHGHSEQFAILPFKQDVPATFVCSGAVLGYLVDEPTWMPEIRVWSDSGRAIPPIDSLDGDAREFANLLAKATSRGLPGPPIKALTQALSELDLAGAQVAVDDGQLRHELREHGIESTDAYPLLREVRAVKTPDEIDRLRKASEANEAGFKALLGTLQPGVSWGELKLAYDLEVVRRGALPGFWGAGSGRAPYRFNWFDPESPGMAAKVEAGQVLKLDIGCTYRRYWADTNRSAAVRCSPPEWFGRVSTALRAAREAYSEYLRPGVPMGQVVSTYERLMWEHGLQEFRGAWGHGLGLQCYDFPAPRINRDTEAPFEENMVLNLEGGPSIVGVGAHSLENTYRITKDGFERWSSDDGVIVEL